MKINPESMLLENLSSTDVSNLREIENKITKGDISLDDSFIVEWIKVSSPKDFDINVLHIRILQSIDKWMWEKFGDQVYRFR